MADRDNLGRGEAGVIRAGEMYTVSAAMQRLGLGEWGWRRLRRQGLRIIRSNGRAFVLADDLIRHMSNTGASNQIKVDDDRGEKTK